MKIVIIIVLILVLLFGYLMVSGENQRKEYEENIKLLTAENYKLIRDSQYADELSKYTIWREEHKLRFTGKNSNYTLFWIEINKKEPNGVKLVGLDGYGIRDKEFLKYTANLVRKINEKSPSNEKE